MNKWLVGNGIWCAACKGSGRGELSDIIEYRDGTEAVFYKPCAACGGQKRVAAEVADIIAARVPPSKPKRHSFWSACLEYRRPKKRALAASNGDRG